MLAALAVTLSTTAFSQSPQYAVVRPDGTTFICPTWDSAHSKAVDGDNIYLPAVIINANIQINKRLNIFGAGHHPDSSLAIGKTIVTGIVNIDSNAKGGHIEGVQALQFYIPYRNKQFNNYTIRRCRANDITWEYGGVIPTDSLPQNMNITENVLNYIVAYGAKNNLISKNVFKGLDVSSSVNLFVFQNTTFENNVFLSAGQNYIYGENCTFRNNVFGSGNILFPGFCMNTFTNNLRVGTGTFATAGSCGSNTITESGTVNAASLGDVFVNYVAGTGFPYTDNYRMKVGSPGINAGSDGTDVGIYGTANPASAGWVPGNPHIYFKEVAPQSDASGNLNIKFRVRANN